MAELSKAKDNEVPAYVTWWLKDNESREIDEDRCIVLQAMHGDDIDYETGPYVIEFAEPVAMRFFYANGLDRLIAKLNDDHPGDSFEPVTASEDPYADEDEFLI